MRKNSLLILLKTKKTKINQIWITDITYIDYFYKKVISWGLYNNQKTDKLINTLKIAVKKRKHSLDLICHFNKGSHIWYNSYRQFLKDHNFVFSYTSLDHSSDENASQESFHSLLKKEKLYQIKIYTYEDSFNAIFEYIEEFYNHTRIHSSIGYLSPNDFEKLHKIR